MKTSCNRCGKKKNLWIYELWANRGEGIEGNLCHECVLAYAAWLGPPCQKVLLTEMEELQSFDSDTEETPPHE